MSAYNRFFQHSSSDGLNTDKQIKYNEDGSAVLVDKVYPYSGLSYLSFSPVEVIKAGGSLKSSPSLSNSSISSVDNVINSVSNLIDSNNV